MAPSASYQRVVKLKSEFERENRVRYNQVFITRYDMIFYPRTNLAYVEDSKVYGAKRNTIGTSEFAVQADDTPRESANTIQDYFYICNSRNADLIGDFFDHRFAYSVRHSPFSTISPTAGSGSKPRLIWGGMS